MVGRKASGSSLSAPSPAWVGRRAFGNRVVRVDSRVESQSHSERNTAMMRPFRRLKGSAVTVVALLFATIAGGGAGAQEAGKAAGNTMIVYVGTYTGPKSKGIYMMRFDPATGKLTEPELAGEV